MGITLVVVDHHQSKEDFSALPNGVVVHGQNLDGFYAQARIFLDQDFDLVLSDQDPDGLTSTVVYYLNRPGRRNFVCTRQPLRAEDVRRLGSEGVRTILALDWFPYRSSALETFEKVVLIVPQLSGLPNVNTSEIVFQCMDTENVFARDVSAVGTVCDYQVESALAKVCAVIYDYPTLFFDVLPLVARGGLDQYSIMQSKFFDLVNMFWAPYVVEGEAGCAKFVELILGSPPFSLNELFMQSQNPAVRYLQEGLENFNRLLKRERAHFDQTNVVRGRMIVYEPLGDANFVSRFSSMLCDQFEDAVILVKSRQRDAPEKFRYSLRRRNVPVNLGLLLEEMQAGEMRGGHPEAAGVSGVVDDAAFEQAVQEKLETLGIV